MYNGKTVSVVVPAYNEEGFVGAVLSSIPDFVDRVYAIDDHSTDNTWQEIKHHAEQLNQRQDTATTSTKHAIDGGYAFENRIVPIHHSENKGVGGALKTGYKHALQDQIDVTAVMAGDNQMDPDQLSALIDPIVTGSADYTKGNRLLSADFRHEMPRFRLVGNYMLSVLTKIASGYWSIGDPQNGFTAISYRALNTIRFEDAYEDYGFANDLLTRLNRHDLRVADVAMPAIYGDEESSIQYHTFIPTLSALLLKLFLWRLTVKYLSRKRWGVLSCYLFSGVFVGLAALTELPTTAPLSGLFPVPEYTLLLFVLLSGVFFAMAVHRERTHTEQLEQQITAHLDDNA